MKAAIDYLLKNGGALVSSSACSEIELADARVHGRMWVTEDGLGVVARLPEWLTLAHQRSNAEPGTCLVGVMGICDQCDQPATSFARDVRRVEDRNSAVECWEPVGDVKSGCSAHPVVSEEVC